MASPFAGKTPNVDLCTIEWVDDHVPSGHQYDAKRLGFSHQQWSLIRLDRRLGRTSHDLEDWTLLTET